MYEEVEGAERIFAIGHSSWAPICDFFFENLSNAVAEEDGHSEEHQKKFAGIVNNWEHSIRVAELDYEMLDALRCTVPCVTRRLRVIVDVATLPRKVKLLFDRFVSLETTATCKLLDVNCWEDEDG